MKKIAPYLVVFLLSSGAAVMMVVALLLAKPELMPGVAHGSPDSLRTADRERGAVKQASSAGRTVMPPDSVQRESRPTSRPSDIPEMVLASEQRNSATTAEPLRTSMDRPPSVVTAADSVQKEERKSMAKVLEAMDPASAARILKDFPDGDVKQIILTIKRRQAAKILAALDPDRAARIMR